MVLKNRRLNIGTTIQISKSSTIWGPNEIKISKHVAL
jgi:hypothetical protein